jgi:hypothetical protein
VEDWLFRGRDYGETMLFIVDDSERTTSWQKTSELPDKRIYFSQFDWIGSGGDDLADLGFFWTEICGQEKLTCWRFLYSWTCVTMLPPHFTCTHHSGNVLLLSAAFLLTLLLRLLTFLFPYGRYLSIESGIQASPTSWHLYTNIWSNASGSYNLHMQGGEGLSFGEYCAS